MSKGQYCRSSGKRSFGSQEAALAELRSIRENPDPIKQSLGYLPTTVYKCKSGSHWHLSAKAANKYVRRRRRKGARAYR